MLVGVLGTGENPSDQEANDALSTLNEIVDKWNVESLMIPSNEDVVFPCSGKKIYTFGPGGDIDELRPPSGIIGAYFNFQNTGMSGPMSFPVRIITENEYNAIVLKEFGSTIPQVLFYRSSFPLAQVFVYPLPSSGSMTLTVSGQFRVFASLESIIDLPSAYVKALRYNLAAELSTEYGRQLDPAIREMAVGAKAFIKSTNGAQKQLTMFVDRGLRVKAPGYNIYSGQ